MGNFEKQGLEAILAEILRVKERLRFNSEKLGYIDVEQEGFLALRDDGLQRPDITITDQANDIYHRVP